MKCVCLCRQSSGTDNADESLSLEVQATECLKLASQKGFEVLDVYKDANTSGRLYPEGFETLSTFDLAYQEYCKETKLVGHYRKGLGDALKRLDEIDYIVCFDVTRLFRPLNGSFLQSIVTQELIKHNVKVLTVKEGEVDFSKFQDFLVTSLTSTINSEQIKIQTQKSKASTKKLIDAGEYHPGLNNTLGYHSTGRKREVFVVKEEAEVVKNIYELFLNGFSFCEISKKLSPDYERICNKHLYIQIIKRVLLNPTYCGYVRTTDGELVKSKQLIGKEIVSFDSWKKTSDIINSRKVGSYKHKKQTNFLSPYIRCGECGDKMVLARGANNVYYYICKRHILVEAEKCCSSIRYSGSTENGIGLLEAIRPLLFAQAIENLKLDKKKDEESEKLELLKIKEQETDKKEKKLTDLYLNGALAEETYTTSIETLKAKKNKIRSEITQIEMTLGIDTTNFDWVRLKESFSGDDRPTEPEMMLYAAQLIKAITPFKDHIEVSTTLGKVSLPRQQLNRSNMVCPCLLQMKDHKAGLYFYYGKPRHVSMINLDNPRHIGTLGELKIFFVES